MSAEACAYCGAVATGGADIGGVKMPRCGAQRCRDRWWDDFYSVRDLAMRWWLRSQRKAPSMDHRRAVRAALGTDGWS